MSDVVTAPNAKAIRLYLSYWRNFKLPAFFSVLFSLLLALQAIVIPLLIALILGQLIKDHTVSTGLLV